MSKLSRPSAVIKSEDNPFGSGDKKDDVDNAPRKSMNDFTGGYAGKNWLNFNKQ